jgi:autotransporter-associated beta strand protein
MRLFQGEQNIRSGVGAEGTPGRIEAFFPAFAVPANKWSVWEATYTIIDPLQSNIFQLFHEGGQLWAFHLRMSATGRIYFSRRRTITGLPDEITLASGMVGKSLGIMVRSNGTQYELYKRTLVPLGSWELVTTGSYTAAVDRKISYRWGMYYGSQAGQSIPEDGLLFVSGVKLYTVDAPGGDPPPPPPPVPTTYYWDNNGATAGFGTASGVWGETTSGGTQGWSTDATGATLPGEVSTNTVDTLHFGTDVSGRGLGTGTIQISDTVAAADITFGSQSGNITLNGGEIEMPGNRTITIGGTGKTHTIRSDLLDGGALTIAGAGTLVLNGANTFSGPLVVGDNSGGLRLRVNSIGNTNGTPTAAGAPTSAANGIIQLGQTSNGSTLELAGSTSAQSTNRQIRIGSNGGGSGGATIQNNNTDPAHTLTFTNSAFNVAATDTASFDRTLTLRGSNTGDNQIQGAIINNIGGTGGKVALTKSEAGTWVLSGANTYTDPTSISGGTLRIGNGGSTGSLSPSSSISLSNGATLEFRRTGTITQGTNFTSGAISGTGSLVQSGTGTTILNVDNTYTGLTTVDAGALRIQHASALGTTAAGTVVNGSAASGGPRLELAGGITTVSGESITISGGGNFFGALTSQSGTNTWAGSVTIAAPDTRIGASEGATLRVSGVINSGGQPHGLIIRAGLVENGGVVLSAANTYLGDTRVFVGKLQLDGGNNRLPVGTRLSLGATTNITEFDLNGRNQTIAGLSIIEGATASNNSVNNSSATLSTLTVNTAAGSPSSYSGIIKGNLALAKAGPESLNLSGANTHTGGTTLAADGGTLFATITQTTSALGNGPVSIGSGSTVFLENQSTTNVSNLPTVANTFTGTGLLRMQFAAGTTPRNTYMPNIAGFGGTIQLSNSGATGDKWNATNIGAVAASVIVDSGSTIFMSNGTNSVSGGITLNGAGNSENRGAVRLSGSTTTLAGGIRLAGDATIGMENLAARITGNITSAASGMQVLTLGGAQGSQAGGRLEGDIGGGIGAIHLAVANGNYTLSGINTYTGNTTVNSGTLQLAAAARLTFVLGQASGVNNQLSGAGTAILNGEFVIDTTAADDLSSGTWVLENVTTLVGPYGSSFSVVGFTDIGGDKWEKVLGPNKKYTFDETTGTLTLTSTGGNTSGIAYETWAATNAGGQAPGLDFDYDGVTNGIEFFLNAEPGFTALSVLDANNTITWTNGGNLPASAYGTKFVVQTSGNLTHWDDVPAVELNANTDGPGGTLSYTLAGEGNRFVRLKVNPLGD